MGGNWEWAPHMDAGLWGWAGYNLGMAMQALLQQLVEMTPLDRGQARAAFDAVMDGQAGPEQTAALLALLAVRDVAVPELIGAAEAMRARVTPVAVPAGLTPIDIVGTGGDHSGTFNISTAAALVVAGAGREQGVCVAKHGNRAVTSRSGSSQALEALGVGLTADPATLTRCLEAAGICFCFAPHHHPAMKHAAPVRKALGFRTVFNLVGPLTNPAGVQRLLLGVFSRAMVKPMAEALQGLGVDRAMVVHGQIPAADGSHIDGFDELSTCGPTQVASVSPAGIERSVVDPTELGLPYSHPAALRVESPQQSAEVILRVLSGDAGPAEEVVLLNAAGGLVIAGLAGGLEEGLELARRSIGDGLAMAALEALRGVTPGGGG